MFLAINLLTNWIFWVVVVAVLIIAAIITVNVIINSKIKAIEKKDVAEKERNLRIKLGLEDPDAEEIEEVTSDEETDDKQEEIDEQDEEKAEEIAEEVEEEPSEEVVEEEKPAEEVVEEKSEPVEEVVEEKTEEPAEDAEEAEPVKEEIKEEKKQEKPQKQAPAKKQPAPKKVEEKVEEKEEDDSDAEDLLKDIPDADEMEKELDKKQAEEEKAKEEKLKAEEEAKQKAKEEKTVKADKPAKTEAKKATPVEEKKANAPKQANGKWLLIPESDGYYFGKLFASNGELLLQTERYKGVSGLKSGIETIKKNIEKDNFEITVDKNKTYNFKLFASNHGLLCIGEGYTSRENALSAINSVKNFSTSLTFVSDEAEILEDKTFKIAEKDKSENGKWVIFEDTDGYTHAELKANNGQVLFVTEKYKGINSLRSGLDSIRKNITNGNFSMRKDKNDNFNFKIFSENKRLLGLGAGYSSATNCESAILSVMKFCDSTVVFNNSDEIDE